MRPIIKKMKAQKRRKTTNLRPQVVLVNEDFCQKKGSDVSVCAKSSQVDKTNPILDSFFQQQKLERQNELEKLASREMMERETLSNLSRVLRRRLEDAVNECSQEILQSHRTLSQRSSFEATSAEEQESNENAQQSEVFESIEHNSPNEQTRQAINTNDENETTEVGSAAANGCGFSAWDQFFERQRLERQNEVSNLAAEVNHVTRREQRAFLIASMLRQRVEQSATTTNPIRDEDSTPARSELSSLRESHRVRNLLSDSFRQRLEQILSSRNNRQVNVPAPMNSQRFRARNRIPTPTVGPRTNPVITNGGAPPAAPPLPPRIPRARGQHRMGVPQPEPQPPNIRAIPPPPGPPPGMRPPVPAPGDTEPGRTLVRNNRFDELAELGNLVGSQVVSRVLNSAFADMLELHLIDRMESNPETFSAEARRQNEMLLNSLPRTRRVRNDFTDIGIDPDGLPRLLENNNNNNFFGADDFFNEEGANAVPRSPGLEPGRRNLAREQQRMSFGGDDRRMSRLETMIETMQNMMTRQSNAQAHMENTLQQLVLNQSMLSSQPNANVRLMSERGGTCVVCLDETQQVNSAFYKCGHMIACDQCAAILLAINPMCPLCRQPILDVIKLYRVETGSSNP